MFYELGHCLKIILRSSVNWAPADLVLYKVKRLKRYAQLFTETHLLSYGASPTTWDHTMLPTTQRR